MASHRAEQLGQKQQQSLHPAELGPREGPAGCDLGRPDAGVSRLPGTWPRDRYQTLVSSRCPVGINTSPEAGTRAFLIFWQLRKFIEMGWPLLRDCQNYSDAESF